MARLSEWGWQVAGALAVVGGAIALATNGEHSLITHGCRPPAVVVATYESNDVTLTDCGGISNSPVRSIVVRAGGTLDLSVSHTTLTSIEFTSSKPKVIRMSGRQAYAVRPGSTVILETGISCQVPASDGTCPALRITVQ